MSLRARAQRTWTSMKARANRDSAVSDAKWRLDLWRDYGDPVEAEAAIRIIREAM